jgi:hypothetical protein
MAGMAALQDVYVLVHGEACWEQLQQLTALKQLSRLIHHVTGSTQGVFVQHGERASLLDGRRGLW